VCAASRFRAARLLIFVFPNGIRSVEDAGHELIERLREAVRIRLIAEVPLGAFLSGELTPAQWSP
jgi:asparagine synthetase B (glutamine-hydrolysing)